MAKKKEENKKGNNKAKTTEKKTAKGKAAASKKPLESAKNPVKTKPPTKGKKAGIVKKAREEGIESEKKESSRKTQEKSNRKKDKTLEKKENDPGKKAGLFTEMDIYLFKEGRHYRLYEKFGAHPMEHNGVKGTYFAVWAPNADQVSVIGDFNEWNRGSHRMESRHDESGIWEIFIPEVKQGNIYKYYIKSHNQGYEAEKGDPFAFRWETPPDTASMVWYLNGEWQDEKWMKSRKKESGKSGAMSVYELHIGSWARVPEEENRSLTYREMAEKLPSYIKDLGFTHVEFMPVMEHPFYGSWGYQITGYFAPSSRYGTPEDFIFLVSELHKAGIGVILDWVPSHFPSDLHGLHYFDGTHLYEHADPRKGYHPDWQSYIFNYGRNEVKSFLISNALFWLDKFHVDGLRVDAVASMLYLDYSRKEGEWEPNEHGGRENLESIRFLKEFNETVYREYPDVHTIAEESTAYPKVSRPTFEDGLGFGMKWMMGWMHDTLNYFANDPVHRSHHQNSITFSINYAFSENFMLPLSHDEVVYGKGSLINKMPGDDWQKFANLRCLFAYMYGHPGTKLIFMGGEFAQFQEWGHERSLDWHLEEQTAHSGMQKMLKELNNLYKNERALYELQFSNDGFQWIDINDSANSVISFIRKGKDEKEMILAVCNFTPVSRENYRIGIPAKGVWKEIFNSDKEEFGGSGVVNANEISTENIEVHSRDYSLSLTLPPLGVVYLKFRAG